MMNFFTFFSEANIFELFSHIEGVLLLTPGTIEGLILSFGLKLVFKTILGLIF